MLSRASLVATGLVALAATLLYQLPPSTLDIRAPVDISPVEILTGVGGIRGYEPSYYPGAKDAPLLWGHTHYYLVGPEKGRRVVLVHGISKPAMIFKDQVKVLSLAGYRVLAYDLYGRGYSDSPGIESKEALYVSQLQLLLHHVGWTKCDVIGLSMGGGISVAFTAAFPEMVDTLILMAPAGLIEESKLTLLITLGKVPFLLEFLQLLVGYIVKLPWEHWVPGWLGQGEVGSMILTDIQSARYHRGFLRSIISSVRHFPLSHLQKYYAKAGRLPDGSPRRVMAIWGDADTVVPYDCATKAARLIPSLDLHTIPGAGHDICVTHPMEVNAAILRFLPSP